MSIISSHRNFILERFLLEYLLKGYVPTADQLEEKLEEYEKQHPSMAEPTSKQVDFDIEYYQESSAEKIQEIAKYVSDDVSIITREMKRLVERGKAHYERWTTELARLTNKARRIENEIDGLLFMERETTGFFSHVTDLFVDTNNIDMELTTAKIDTSQTSVSLQANSSWSEDASGGTRINLSHLTEGDISFNVLSTTPTGYDHLKGTTPLDCFQAPTQESNGWTGIITKGQPGQLVVELKAHLHHAEAQKVSRIVFSSNVANAGGNCTIACMHSVDGYQWYMVDHPTPVQSLEADNISWHFPVTDMYWIKFIITKNNYDHSSGTAYYYEVGASSIRLYGHQYESGFGNVLVTKALQPLDHEENSVPFTMVSLDACEENVVKEDEKITDIKYYLSVSHNQEDWIPEVRVEPSMRENRTWPFFANFGGVSKIDNSGDSSLFHKFKGTIVPDITSPMILTRSFEYDVPNGFIPYGFKDTSFAVINTAIPLYDLNTNTKLCPQHISNSVEVWRNIFDPKNLKNIVRDIPAGWGHTGEHYYCSFCVSTSDGIMLDFGDTLCIIDGVERTGEVTVSKGMHHFMTTVENWSNFYAEDYVPPTTEAKLESLDLLYPYNHKIIIEGFNYLPEFEGERKYYAGVDIVAQYYCKRTSAHDLENNIVPEERLSKFAFLKALGTKAKPAAGILLARNINFSDHINEKCRLLWSSGESSFRFVKLRVELSTTDEAYTPVLYSFQLKVGA